MSTSIIFGFFIGFVAEIFLLISKPITNKDLVGILGTLFFSILIVFIFGGLIFIDTGATFQLSITTIFVTMSLWGIFFGFWFSRRLITPIGARSLLIVNTLVALVAYERLGTETFFFWLFLIPSLYVLINAFTNIDFHFRTKFFLYTWYVILLLIVCLYVYPLWDLFYVLSGDSHSVTQLSMFVYGGVYLYVIVQLTFLLQFFQYKRKGETKRSVQYRIKEHKKLMASGYIRHKGDNFINGVLFVLLVAFLYVNSLYSYIDLRNLLLFTLLCVPIIHLLQKDTATVKP